MCSVCGFWSTQKENEKYGNEVGTLTSTTTSIFSDKLLFLSSDTEKSRRQFVTWISLYQNVQKWSDHRCTTLFRNKGDYAWWNDPAKCLFFILFFFTYIFWSITLRHFIKHKYLISEDFIVSKYIFSLFLDYLRKQFFGWEVKMLGFVVVRIKIFSFYN